MYISNAAPLEIQGIKVSFVIVCQNSSFRISNRMQFAMSHFHESTYPPVTSNTLTPLTYLTRNLFNSQKVKRKTF